MQTYDFSVDIGQSATFMKPRADRAAQNLDGARERVRTLYVLALDTTAPYVALEARWWMARHADGAAPLRCSVWVQVPGGLCVSGTGRATGTGYHKASQALANALDAAGFRFAVPFGGAGDGAMATAAVAAARAAGATGRLAVLS